MAKPLKPAAPKRDSAASKQRLLEAAIDVFSEHGYNATTTRMVAKKAGLNAALIARYFGSKEKLLLAVFEQQKNDFFSQDLPPLLPDLEDELINYSKAMFEHARMNTKAMRIIGGFAFTNDHFRRRLQKDTIQILDRHLSERFIAMKKAGAFPAQAKIEPVAKALSSYFIGQVLLNHLIFDKPLKDIEEETRTLIHFFASLGKGAGS
jgi:AcrR family transcriptional regulator